MVAGNEAVVGEVLQQFCADTGVGREEVVIVTKNSSRRGRAAAIANLERQLAELRVQAFVRPRVGPHDEEDGARRVVQAGEPRRGQRAL